MKPLHIKVVTVREPNSGGCLNNIESDMKRKMNNGILLIDFKPVCRAVFEF